MLLEALRNEIDNLRARFGHAICTDLKVSGDIASYVFDPLDRAGGYTVEIDLISGLRRNCGLGPGCFWTDWR